MVAYHYTANSVDGMALQDMVCSIIQKAESIGLNIVAVTSDMGASNRSMWRCFGIKAARQLEPVTSIPHPADPGTPDSRLHFLADVPHLVKNLRCAFAKHKVIIIPQKFVQEHNLVSNVVDIGHVCDLMDVQDNMPHLKLAPKLTKKCLDPSHFDKMNVGNALNLFSNSVSAALTYLVERKGRDETYLTTAWFVGAVNKWFDLMSCRNITMALSKFNVEQYEAATKFLNSFIELFKNLQIGEKSCWKPVQTGVIMSTSSVLHLSEHLLSTSKLDFLMTSRLTQDCLENLFSCVRLKNPVPTPREFKYALKVISVAQYLKPAKRSSYQEDDRQFLGDLLPAVVRVPEVEPELSMPDVSITSLESLTEDDEASLFYLAGYCLQSLRKQKQICSSCYLQDDLLKDYPHTLLVKLKDYTQGALCRVRKDVFDVVKVWEMVVQKLEPQVLFNNIKKELVTKCLTATEDMIHDMTVPQCHPVMTRLVNKFVVVRVHIMCRKLTASKKSNAIPLGSKSAARHHAKKVN